MINWRGLTLGVLAIVAGAALAQGPVKTVPPVKAGEDEVSAAVPALPAVALRGVTP